MVELRPFCWDDLRGLAALFGATDHADNTGRVMTEESLKHALSMPGREPEKAISVLEGTAAGTLRAATHGQARAGHGETLFGVWVEIDPEHRDPELFDALIDYQEDRARAADGVAAIHSHAFDGQSESIAAYERNGFRPIRWFLELVRDLTQPIAEASLPGGMSIRHEQSDDDIRDSYDAIKDAFEDHWDPVDMTFEQVLHLHRSPESRSEFCLLAYDTDGVCAGSCVVGIRKEYNEKHGVSEGHVHVLGVRRAYRKQGVARALLTEGLRRLRDAGMNAASIEVDADSPTGANVLYESVGFRERSRMIVFEKRL